MKRKHYILLSIVSLALGILVYILFHPVPVAFDLIPWIKSFPKIPIHSPTFNQIIQCYAADMFWAMSFAFLIQCILMLPPKKSIVLLLTALLGATVELLQLFHVMRGVFDPVDIIVYFVGAVIAAIMVRLGGKDYGEHNK